MKACPECGAEISANALTCSTVCGSKFRRRPKYIPIDRGEYYEIPVGGGSVVKICKCHAHLVRSLNWHHIKGYARNNFAGYMHLVILPKRDGYFIDHANRDTFDNRCSNLRYATFSQHLANRHFSGVNRLSRFKGVSKNSKNRWRARIRVMDNLISLGHYAKEEEAALAYNFAARHHFGEFAELNNISVQ